MGMWQPQHRACVLCKVITIWALFETLEDFSTWTWVKVNYKPNSNIHIHADTFIVALDTLNPCSAQINKDDDRGSHMQRFSAIKYHRVICCTVEMQITHIKQLFSTAITFNGMEMFKKKSLSKEKEYIVKSISSYTMSKYTLLSSRRFN